MMKMRKPVCLLIAVMLICGAVSVSCKSKKKVEIKPVKGVLENPISSLKAPEIVEATINRHVLDSCYESILNDTVSNVSVWSLIRAIEEQSTEGFGIVVVNKGYATAFPDFRHGNNPSARYDSVSGDLWLTGGVMEGTGVLVERPSLLRFREKGNAYMAAAIDPYEMQQALCRELSYSVDGDNITLYNGDKELVTVTNTIKDMGGFYDDVVWIGEQLTYDISGENIYVHVIPGVNFVTGKVLHYDDMPTISARVTLNDGGGFTLSDVKIEN
ncbi:MAG: hypothetical protein IJL57_02150 [Bacteroidales bacterium]|nr:hypothetical protein [Bacteroidales bacterium]